MLLFDFWGFGLPKVLLGLHADRICNFHMKLRVLKLRRGRWFVSEYNLQGSAAWGRGLSNLADSAKDCAVVQSRLATLVGVTRIYIQSKTPVAWHSPTPKQSTKQSAGIVGASSPSHENNCNDFRREIYLLGHRYKTYAATHAERMKSSTSIMLLYISLWLHARPGGLPGASWRKCQQVA